MGLGKLWVIAVRDLGRNRRRSILTLLSIALGLALLMMLNGLVAGVIDDTIDNSVRYQTGHVQVRAAAYEPELLGLQPEVLLDGLEDRAARAAALPDVRAASPVLWVGGFVDTADESVGVQANGIQPESAVFDALRAAVTDGAFLSGDDREGIVVGGRLAENLGLAVGRRVSVSLLDATGTAHEGTFPIRGIATTGIGVYDERTVWMPLDTARAITGTGDRASAILVMLDDREDADRVAEALEGPDVVVSTWRDMNAILLGAMETAGVFYYILDAIVLLVVATIVVNTLLMSVFERVREVGILAALGLRRRQILTLFLLEGLLLGVAGVAVGLALGSLGVAWLATRGVYLGDISALAGGMAIGSTMYGRFVPGTFAALAVGTWLVVLLASLVPAWYASRLQPADALHHA